VFGVVLFITVWQFNGVIETFVSVIVFFIFPLAGHLLSEDIGVKIFNIFVILTVPPFVIVAWYVFVNAVVCVSPPSQLGLGVVCVINPEFIGDESVAVPVVEPDIVFCKFERTLTTVDGEVSAVNVEETFIVNDTVEFDGKLGTDIIHFFVSLVVLGIITLFPTCICCKFKLNVLLDDVLFKVIGLVDTVFVESFTYTK
jgi:hypothetical protein